MKRKDITNNRAKTVPELTKDVVELEKKLSEKKLSGFGKPSKNSREMRTMRNTIAVLHTIIREKEFIEES